MKLVVVPKNLENFDSYIQIGAHAFIFGLKGYSSGYPQVTLEEISSIRKKYSDIEIFLALNKNIFNSELPKLEEVMKKIDTMNIQGILFYDLAIVSIHNRCHLQTQLVWHQTHMVTNYQTCNYYYEKNVAYGVLSNEITLDEMVEIAKKTKMKLFAMVLGYPLMSFSRRKLLSHYFLSQHKEKEKDAYWITNRDENYLLKEEESGNAIYYGKLLNGSSVITELPIEYAILHEEGIEESLFLELFSLFQKLIDSKDKSYQEKIDHLIGDYRGFFFQKTIYKVKKND